MSKKYIVPTELTIGFQQRSDTYSEKLAFITYFHINSLINKSKWEKWRDKSIETVIVSNIPTEGFVLNKTITHPGYNTYYDKIRVYDPRGFEFEINLDNLMCLLYYMNCVNNVLDGKCVYSWYGNELWLLPINSSLPTEKIDSKPKNYDTLKTITPQKVYRFKNKKTYIYHGYHKIHDSYTKKLFKSHIWQEIYEYDGCIHSSHLVFKNGCSYLLECIADSYQEYMKSIGIEQSKVYEVDIGEFSKPLRFVLSNKIEKLFDKNKSEERMFVKHKIDDNLYDIYYMKLYITSTAKMIWYSSKIGLNNGILHISHHSHNISIDNVLNGDNFEFYNDLEIINESGFSREVDKWSLN